MKPIKVRVAIIEDHRLMAEVIALMCQREWGYQVVSADATATAGIDSVRRLRPDVVLLDLGLPDMHPRSLIEQTGAAAPSAKFIAVSSLCNPRTIQLIHESNLDGYLDKTAESLPRLGEVIESVIGGQRSFPPWFRAALARLREMPHAFRNILTDREIEILALIGSACDDEEIARRQDSSRFSAHAARTSIMRKLNIHTTPELMVYAIENGFTRMPESEGLQRSLLVSN